MTIHRFKSSQTRQLHGPFDIIGDVHGCGDELEKLLQQLGYKITQSNSGETLTSGPVYQHPENRTAVFLDDLVDRGPRILDTLRIVHNMLKACSGLTIMGNHDDKLLRLLQGRNVQIKHGLENTLAELENLQQSEQEPFKTELQQFLTTLPIHLILDDGHLLVAHAGLREQLHGLDTDKAKRFALYGETTGETNEYGLPVRKDWGASYTGKPLVIHGHRAPMDEKHPQH